MVNCANINLEKMNEINYDVQVAILLTTYNGDVYLRPLLESLLSQNYKNIKIYIRDDGSSDNSLEIINNFLSENVVLIEDGLGNLKSASSFLQLLSVAQADIYMFCDQDDIWLPEKVLNAVKSIGAYGFSNPLLFHTDLIIVDHELNRISNSFNQHEGISLPFGHKFSHLIVQNCVVGCTMAITDELVKLSALRDIRPKLIAMHDWWFALFATCFGKVIYSSHADILYRQHQNNVSGVSKKNFYLKIFLQFSSIGINRINNYKRKIADQAMEFADFYGDKLPENLIMDLKAVEKLGSGSGLNGVLSCFKRRIFLQNVYMNVSIFYSSLASFLINIKFKFSVK